VSQLNILKEQLHVQSHHCNNESSDEEEILVSLHNSHAVVVFVFFRQTKNENATPKKTKKLYTKEEPLAMHTQPYNPIIFTIFLSFNAAVKKVAQLLPVYRQNARVFFLLLHQTIRLLLLYFSCVFFYIILCAFVILSSAFSL
jgi:hypothetical protein